MIDPADVNDLQLEDVEDYTTDYPPQGFPQSENLHNPSDDESKSRNYRLSRLIAMIRNHKWFAGLMFVMFLVMILVISLIAGVDKAEKQAGRGGRKGNRNGKIPGPPPIVIDPTTLDPLVTEPLMKTLLSAYERHDLDAVVLDRTEGDATPQRQAFYWLATHDNIDSLDHTELIQRYALATFYYALNNRQTLYNRSPTPWFEAHLWLSNEHSCEWKGVQCNSQQHVESIDLEDNNLSGSLPQELALLADHLLGLDLTSNQIYMSESHYDVFDSLIHLRTLLMDDNYLVSDDGLPWQFKYLHKLVKLRLSYNLMAGQLEKEHGVLINMRKLTHLEIESNFFTGAIPSAIHAMPDLVYLYLRRNNFKTDLQFLRHGNMTNLFAVWLDSNTITGSIPTHIGHLTDLASVSITNSSLTGPIPTEMGLLTGLRRLWLYSNKLTGTIPEEVAALSKLEVFEIHGNKIKGSMPESICKAVSKSDYNYKSLTSDCKEVSCKNCCTQCF